MAEKDEIKIASLVGRTLHDCGEVLEWAGAAVPFGSVFGKALKTIPWEDIFDWAGLIYKRYHSSEPLTAAKPAPGKAQPPEGTGVEVSPTAEASVTMRAMADFVVSEPFGLAVGEAVAGFPKLLGDFIGRTHSIETGIWPAFAFEQLARLYFRRELGAAAATSVPEVAQLVEKGLAGELLRRLQADVLKAQDRTPPGVRFAMASGATYLWAVNQSLIWPKIGDLIPGYFSGYESVLDFSPNEVKKAEEQERQLLARLGRMSQRETEHFSEMWLSECDAMIASRKWEPLDQNLTRMKMPLFSALLALEQRGVAPDDVRAKLEKMIAAVKGLGIAPADTVTVLSEAIRMLEAVAEDDSWQFRRSAGRLQKEVASDYRFGLRAKTNAPTIEEGISLLSEVTGWIPMRSSEV